MSETPQLLRRAQARELVGVSEHVFAQMVACGTLKPVYLLAGKDGKPKGRAYFRRVELLEKLGK